MEKQIHMIHASAASGKTTFLKRGKALLLDKDPQGAELYGYIRDSYILMDGDDFISFYSSWPRAPLWWQRPGREYVHAHNLSTILAAAVKLELVEGVKGLVILFNGGMAERKTIEELYVNHAEGKVSISHSVVEIPEKDHRSNIKSRHEERGVTSEAEALAEMVFPANWMHASNNRLAQRSFAKKERFEIYNSFSSAFEKISGSSSTVHEVTPTRGTKGERLIIFGGPLHGKTTVTEKGLAVDPEMPDLKDIYPQFSDYVTEWKRLERKWKDDRIPEDRDARNDAYTALSIAVINSDLPVVVSHFNPEILEAATRSGRTVYAVIIDSEDWTNRIIKEMDKTGKKDGLVFRLLGSYEYAANILRNIKSVKVVSSFEEPIESLKKSI